MATTKKTIETTNDKKDKISIVEIIQDIDARLTHIEDIYTDNRELIIKLVKQGNTVVEFLKDFQIEELNVVVRNFEMFNHIKIMVENSKTGTMRMIVVSKTPKCQGKYALVKSSVRKAFRKIGEEV